MEDKTEFITFKRAADGTLSMFSAYSADIPPWNYLKKDAQNISDGVAVSDLEAWLKQTRKEGDEQDK